MCVSVCLASLNSPMPARGHKRRKAVAGLSNDIVDGLANSAHPQAANVASNIQALQSVAPGEAERLLLPSAGSLREAKAEISSLQSGVAGSSSSSSSSSSPSGELSVGDVEASLRKIIRTHVKTFLKVEFKGGAESLLALTPLSVRLAARLLLIQRDGGDDAVADELKSGPYRIDTANLGGAALPEKARLRLLGQSMNGVDLDREIMACGSEWFSAFNFAVRRFGGTRQSFVVNVSLITIDEHIEDREEHKVDFYPQERANVGSKRGRAQSLPSLSTPHRILSLRDAKVLKTRHQKSVGFFPFFLSLRLKNVDLKKYQVFNEEKEYLESGKQCFLHSLEQSGITPEEIGRINMLNLSFATMATAQDFKFVCNTLDITIILHKYTDGSTVTPSLRCNGDEKKKAYVAKNRFRKCVYGKGNAGKTIHLAAVANHIFVDEKIPLTVYYLKNPEECDKSCGADRAQMCRSSRNDYNKTGGTWSRKIVAWLANSHRTHPGEYVIKGDREMYPILLRPPLPASDIHSTANEVCEDDIVVDAKDKEMNSVRAFRVSDGKPPTLTFALDIESVVPGNDVHIPLMVGVGAVSFAEGALEKYSPDEVRIFEGYNNPRSMIESAFAYMANCVKVANGDLDAKDDFVQLADPVQSQSGEFGFYGVDLTETPTFLDLVSNPSPDPVKIEDVFADLMKDGVKVSLRELGNELDQCGIMYTRSSFKYRKVDGGEAMEVDAEDEEAVEAEDEKLNSLSANVYIHNLRYDLALIEQALNVNKVCKKGATRYSACIIWDDVLFTLLDSIKLLPMSLSGFPKALGLPSRFSKKENISYLFYKEHHYPSSQWWEVNRVNIEDYLVNCSPQYQLVDGVQVDFGRYKCEADYKDAEASVEEILRADPDYFDWNEDDQSCNWGKYYEYYLKWDVLVLAAGMTKLELLVKDLGTRMDIPIFKIPSMQGALTITAIGKRLFNAAGVYTSPTGSAAQGLGGKLRSYVHQSVVGGRIFCPEETPLIVDDTPSIYNDARSLYPSANHYICAPESEGGIGLGFPYTRPEVIPEEVLKAKSFLNDPAYPW